MYNVLCRLRVNLIRVTGLECLRKLEEELHVRVSATSIKRAVRPRGDLRAVSWREVQLNIYRLITYT